MRLKLIACEILARAVGDCAAAAPHAVEVELVPRGLHIRPADLRRRLQAGVDAADGVDAVALAYGLCGLATAGLVARRVPLVIPRAHDCITLFLGSRARYQAQFERCPGTYWYSRDALEREGASGSSLAMGAGTDLELQAVYADYVARYGRDNADYLMETMGAWQGHYRRAAYISLGAPGEEATLARAQAEAARRGWAFERVPADLTLLRRLIAGEWNVDFLVVPPGMQIAASGGADVLACAPSEDMP